jgi:hypothetical protein
MHRQMAAVPQSTVTADLRKPLDIHRNFTAQITLDDKVAIDNLAQASYF